jgi:hypothetical protein
MFLHVITPDAAPRRAGCVELVPGHRVDAPRAVSECMPGRCTPAPCRGLTPDRPSRRAAPHTVPAWVLRRAAHELGRPTHEPWHARRRPRTPGHSIKHLDGKVLGGFELVGLRAFNQSGLKRGPWPIVLQLGPRCPWCPVRVVQGGFLEICCLGFLGRAQWATPGPAALSVH